MGAMIAAVWTMIAVVVAGLVAVMLDTRSGIRQVGDQMRNELRNEIGGLRNEFRDEIGGLRTEMGELRTEVHRLAENQADMNGQLSVLRQVLVPAAHG